LIVTIVILSGLQTLLKDLIKMSGKGVFFFFFLTIILLLLLAEENFHRNLSKIRDELMKAKHLETSSERPPSSQVGLWILL